MGSIRHGRVSIQAITPAATYHVIENDSSYRTMKAGSVSILTWSVEVAGEVSRGELLNNE